MIKRIMKQTAIAISSLVLAFTVSAGDSHKHNSTKVSSNDTASVVDERSHSQMLEDAWLDGKVEIVLLLNEHVSAFKINTDVKNRHVTLTGEVDNEVKKALAEHLVIAVDGVEKVTNNLSVNKESSKRSSALSNLERRLKDASLTASVKLALLASENINGLDIDVDTKEGVVKLYGKTHSPEMKSLAGSIAKNQKGVKEVINNLVVIQK